MTGVLTGVPLKELLVNAGLFVFPSFYEGFSLILLEVLYYGLPALMSDMPQNR